MKYSHDKLLKLVYQKCGSDINTTFNVKQQLGLLKDDLAIFETFFYLQKQGLIEIKYDNNHDMTVSLTYEGLTYFKNKRMKNIKYWLPILLSNTIAIAEIIVAILAYITQ